MKTIFVRFMLRAAFRACVLLAAVFLSVAAAHAGPVSIATVHVGDPGNTGEQSRLASNGDPTYYGSVSYNYNIGKYDVTNTQYAAFLNTVDPTGGNSLGLYDTADAMSTQQGITWNGSSYVVNSGYANKPVVYVSWYSAARFTNWLTNGETSGGTETGVYTLNGLTSINNTLPPDHSALVGTGTKWFLPTENEWYKAAYYKGGSTNAGYWKYPFRNNSIPTGDQPPGGSNSSNEFGVNGYAVTQSMSFTSSQNYLTDVGAYTSAKSPYGAFDMGGDVEQWNETEMFFNTWRGYRGGAWEFYNSNSAASFRQYSGGASTWVYEYLGFRVAELPEPSTITLFVLGTIGVWFAGRRHRVKA